MAIPVMCKCGAVNSLRNEFRVNQLIDVAVHSSVIPVLIPELPVIACAICGFTGIDGSADAAIRWALVTEGLIDCDETHSNSVEHLRYL